jgi:glucokinase
MEYLGIDIGGTNIKWVVLNDDGQVLEKGSSPTDDSPNESEKWKLSVIDLIKEKEGEFQVGISSPGVTDDQNQCILNMPERLKGIENYNWSESLNRPIHVLNDAHSACLAEYESLSSQRQIDHMLMLTLGTGVGGGVIINGELFQGSVHRAGHFGHITVDHSGPKTMTNMVGSLEYAVGNFSVGERTHGIYNSVEELVKAYEKGDALATFWWLSSIQKLATALGSLINAFSPEVIVLGGGITAGAGDLLFKPLREFMRLYEWKPRGQQVEIIKAHYNNYAGAIGAAFFAKSKTK